MKRLWHKPSHKVTAAISTRDIASRLTKVPNSSNIWAYGMNIRRNGDDTGDLYVQFKESGEDSGPGDIYVYFDVPVYIYERWQATKSKGHFHWKYIRGKYQYAKLTGDKKTKMRLGVN